MQIYAIADLHLSLTAEKPMDVFGEAWRGHAEKLERNWRETVNEDDLVLIPGDISWAMQLSAALPDLSFIGDLPGKKVLLKGNHDYWWSTVNKMTQALPDSLFFIHNNFFIAENWGICGSRGWLTPCDPAFQATDESIYLREVSRLRVSLAAARAGGCERLIVMLHFPPVYLDECSNGFTDLLEEYNVETCIFGHIHGDGAHMAPRGYIKGAACHLVACDALDFQPKKIV